MRFKRVLAIAVLSFLFLSSYYFSAGPLHYTYYRYPGLLTHEFMVLYHKPMQLVNNNSSKANSWYVKQVRWWGKLGSKHR